MAGRACNNTDNNTVEKCNADGFPLPDDATFAALRDEALREGFNLNAWADLCAFLSWIGQQERRGVTNPDLPEGVITTEPALFAVLHFLQQSPMLARSSALAPLLRLHKDIVDVAKKGRVAPMFKPIKKRGGAPGMDVHELVIGYAGRAMEELILADYERAKAAAMVANALRASGYNKVTAKTVEKWRDRCREGLGADISDDAVTHFRDLPAEYGSAPAERATNLLKALRNAKALLGT
jgi:hypothetical protein